ncbi:CCL4 protein, partial [Todus mexicanus]|nr:CCL4 protein [Todus mexicanus]NWI71472.1 CCL4 protein [Todus mexicanus]
CCLSYAQRPIPRRMITSAYQTSEKCNQPAVILVTKRGNNICVNPQEPWVQKYLKYFQILQN